QTHERKQKLEDALAAGKALPTGSRKEAQILGSDLTFDEAQADPKTHFDNEYLMAGIQDQTIIVTTSRDPRPELDVLWTKEATSRRSWRSHVCRPKAVTDIVNLHETCGRHGFLHAMIVSRSLHGPTASSSRSAMFSRDMISAHTRRHPIFKILSSRLGERIRDVLNF
ncbi:uncharacterized protein C8Q71DRAFT_683610, partial [Rhodofomes roseus]